MAYHDMGIRYREKWKKRYGRSGKKKREMIACMAGEHGEMGLCLRLYYLIPNSR